MFLAGKKVARVLVLGLGISLMGGAMGAHPMAEAAPLPSAATLVPGRAAEAVLALALAPEAARGRAAQEALPAPARAPGGIPQRNLPLELSA
jgi:hypothetical protein